MNKIDPQNVTDILTTLEASLILHFAKISNFEKFEAFRNVYLDMQSLLAERIVYNDDCKVCHECCNSLATTWKMETSNEVLSSTHQNHIIDILRYIYMRSNSEAAKKELYPILMSIQELDSGREVMRMRYPKEPWVLVKPSNCFAHHVVDSVRNYKITKWYNDVPQLIGFGIFFIILGILSQWMYQIIF